MVMRGQGAIECRCGATARPLKGQGATEYLVLLGAVILIGVIAVALLGFFPSTAPDLTETQSMAYWSSAANPLQIREAAASSDGTSATTIKMLVHNTKTEFLTLTGLNIDGAAATVNQTLPTTIRPGGSTVLTISLARVCPSYTYYSLRFNYSTSALGSQVQVGGKPLVLHCSRACMNNAGVDVGPCPSDRPCCCAGYSNAACLGVCIECE